MESLDSLTKNDLSNAFRIYINELPKLIERIKQLQNRINQKIHIDFQEFTCLNNDDATILSDVQIKLDFITQHIQQFNNPELSSDELDEYNELKRLLNSLKFNSVTNELNPRCILSISWI